MREIKSRAWDKENKRMEKSFEITSQGVVVSNFGQRRYHPEYLLMQYTGLKDKNGKEIYESDVIKNLLGQTRVVNFLDGCFMAGDLANGMPFVELDTKAVEIIGNIYQNSELL